jgi:hypothetical protein
VLATSCNGRVKSKAPLIPCTMHCRCAGASGSGKTHTVLGGKQSPGLVDRITDEVFGSRYDQRTCTVSMSVEELYCVSAQCCCYSSYPQRCSIDSNGPVVKSRSQQQQCEVALLCATLTPRSRSVAALQPSTQSASGADSCACFLLSMSAGAIH